MRDRGPPDERIKRYELANIRIFRRALARAPWLGLALCGIAALAGAALALGWVGSSTARIDAGLRAWISPVLWWLFGAWVGVEAAHALVQRRARRAGRPSSP